KNGNLGLWDITTAAVTSLGSDQGSVEFLSLSSDGRELALGGTSGVFSTFDLQTRIMTSYMGHGVRLSAISAPDAGYPYFVSGDVNGNLRVWPRRRPLARVVLT